MKHPYLLLLLPAIALSAEVQSLTLPEAIDLALRQNPDIVIARLDEEKAQLAVRIAKDPFAPKVYAGSGLAYTYGYPNTIEGQAPSIIDVRTDMALYNRPKSLQLAATRESARGAVLQTRSKTEEIAYRTAGIFLDAEEAGRDVELALRQKESLERVKDIVVARIAEGRELPIASRRADLDLARAKQRIDALVTDQGYAEGSLAMVLGFPPGDRVHAVGDDDALAASLQKAQPSDEDAAVVAALATSNSLKSLESQIAAKNLEVRAQSASRLPQISLVAQYSLFYKNAYEKYFTKFQSNNAQIGIAVQFPLFVGSAVGGQEAQAEIDLKRLRQEVNLERNRISLETRRCYEDIKNAEDSRAFARLDLEVAREQLSILLSQGDEGRASSQQVEQARFAEQEKWMLYYSAEDKLERARLNLLRQTGSLLAALR